MFLVALSLVTIVHISTILFMENITLRSENLMDFNLLCGRIKCVLSWLNEGK
jgi:hypothetical protein